MTKPHYKRGTICKDGKLYGRYPDGSLYRIYSTTDRPFLQLVDVNGETFLRIRQATEHGYTDCPCPGAADLSYPSSALRRSRTVGGVYSTALSARYDGWAGLYDEHGQHTIVLIEYK